MASKLRMGRKAAGKGAKAYAALQLIERAAARPEPRRRSRLSTLVLVGGGAAAAVYFFDPQQGARRRNVARDRAMALLRGGKQEALRKADYAAGQAKGAAHEVKDKATPDQPKPELTDQDLARKVETVIFRDADVPKGQINVDAAGRTVSLRGEAPNAEMIEELVGKADAIPEVEQVENFLHLPGEPAPTRPEGDAGASGKRKKATA